MTDKIEAARRRGLVAGFKKAAEGLELGDRFRELIEMIQNDPKLLYGLIGGGVGGTAGGLIGKDWQSALGGALAGGAGGAGLGSLLPSGKPEPGPNPLLLPMLYDFLRKELPDYGGEQADQSGVFGTDF